MGAHSIYTRALGADFHKLHPKIQRRFGFNSSERIAAIGRGTMEKVWVGPWFTIPFLKLGTWRNILFPQMGVQIPFTIENYAYVDSFGRETVTWIREFQFPEQTRRFDATMIFSEQRKKIVDYLGTHQHLAVEIEMKAAANGGMQLSSGSQYFYEGPVAFKFPMLFSGYADVCEWYDEEDGLFHIEVKVANRWFGPLFGYRGSFEVEYVEAGSDNIPHHVKPVREEHRE